MRETLAIVAALGGRHGWRWWLPLGVYAGVAALARVWFEAPFHGLVRVSTSAAEALLLATAVSCVVLSLAGRFALSLGHRRSVVCAVLILTTLVLPSLAIG
ncbi:hypothetical protein G7085_16450 [Tessaracoccus sp. HDW20]|uniref:hypothetical protein n=1 Tax=Tessaracoccus coleopterorum TaxID=2714950 RepID=UPI0018D42F9E|nr:hypothetical protein [Tessaracoccus coleopterorum]NHB85649.1 hypothetical protein [Tessaracoccus coleopterorum]